MFSAFFIIMFDYYDSFFTILSNIFHLIYDYAPFFTHYCDDSDSFDVEGAVAEGTAEIHSACFLVRIVASCSELARVLLKAW